MRQLKKVPFNYDIISNENSWLLGFIFAEATIGIQQGSKVIKIYNKDKILLEKIKEKYQLPYKVTEQRNKNNIVYFIRISDQDFIKSLETHGFAKDKNELKIPQMNFDTEERFLKGFLEGKGSYFHEKDTLAYGFKVVYRSKSLVQDIANKIALHCNVRYANLSCRFIINQTSCQIKYVNSECDLIREFLK